MYKKTEKVTDKHGKTLFKCTAENCHKTFSARSSVSRHQKKFHPEMGFVKTAGRPINPLKRENPHVKPMIKPKTPTTPTQTEQKIVEMYRRGLISFESFEVMIKDLQVGITNGPGGPQKYQWNPTLELQLNHDGRDTREQYYLNMETVWNYLTDSGRFKDSFNASEKGQYTDLFDSVFDKQIWVDDHNMLHYFDGDSIDCLEIYPGGALDKSQNGIITKLWQYASYPIRKYLALKIGKKAERTDSEIEALYGTIAAKAGDNAMHIIKGFEQIDEKPDKHMKILLNHILQKYKRPDVAFEL